MKILKIILITMAVIIGSLGLLHFLDFEPLAEFLEQRDQKQVLAMRDKEDKHFDDLKLFFFGHADPVYNKYKISIDDKINQLDEVEDLTEIEGLYYVAPEELKEDPLKGIAVREAIMYSAALKRHLKDDPYVLIGEDFNLGGYLSYHPLTVFKIEGVLVTNIQHDLVDNGKIYKSGSLVTFKDSNDRSYCGICLMPQHPAVGNKYTFYGFINTIFADGNILTAGVMYDMN